MHRTGCERTRSLTFSECHFTLLIKVHWDTESFMMEQDVRADIAFIRHAIEDGRSYANARGPDMVVWGIASTIGFSAPTAGCSAG